MCRGGWWATVNRVTKSQTQLKWILMQAEDRKARNLRNTLIIQFSSVQFSCSVVSDSLRPHELQHARLPCPSPSPRACSNSYPSSRWCHPTISSSVVPFSSCPQSFPASGSFPMSQFFTSGGQSIGFCVAILILKMEGKKATFLTYSALLFQKR